MKKLFTISILLILFGSSCYSQIEKLNNFAKTKQSKVKVGMSVAEVKAVFSNPKAIEGGFPSSDEVIRTSVPEQRGQLNYSTWTYFYPAMKILYDSPIDATYSINGVSVTEADYKKYATIDEAYYIDGRIITIENAEGYKVTGRGNELKKVPITERKYTSASNEKVNKTFIPMLCIIFEKGTQSVADSRMYFMMQ